jgi:hypothetical protein
MDDGYYIKNRSVKFATHSFTKQEVEELNSLLNQKFGLVTTINEDKRGAYTYYSIYIKKESLLLFKDIVKPFLLPSMFYKVGDAERY